MMETYHKINGIYKRHTEGPNKGRFIMGEWAVPEFEYLRHNEWEFTEKIDGTNIRIEMWAGYEEPKFAGRSDNAIIPEPLKRYLEATFRRELFEKADLATNPIILFGEGYGSKIQNGGTYRQDQSFILFDVKIGDWWLTRDNVNDIAARLGIDSVPVIGTGTLYDAIELVSDGMASHIGRAVDAEGIIAVPSVPLMSRNGDRIITKIKGVDFR